MCRRQSHAPPWPAPRPGSALATVRWGRAPTGEAGTEQSLVAQLPHALPGRILLVVGYGHTTPSPRTRSELPVLPVLPVPSASSCARRRSGQRTSTRTNHRPEPGGAIRRFAPRPPGPAHRVRVVEGRTGLVGSTPPLASGHRRQPGLVVHPTHRAPTGVQRLTRDTHRRSSRHRDCRASQRHRPLVLGVVPPKSRKEPRGAPQ